MADLRAAGFVALALVGAGLLLGWLWAAITPTISGATLPLAGVLTDENEGLVGGDGRYLLIVAAAGLVSGAAAWTWSRHRGPLLALALIVGGLAGASAVQLSGRLLDGGDRGRPGTLSDGSTALVTSHLPLAVHMAGLVFVWPALAALVYGIAAAFAAQDDLGRPDPVRDRLVPPAPTPPAPPPVDGSVGPGGDPQHGWGHGDTAGPLQQRDLPPQ